MKVVSALQSQKKDINCKVVRRVGKIYIVSKKFKA